MTTWPATLIESLYEEIVRTGNVTGANYIIDGGPHQDNVTACVGLRESCESIHSVPTLAGEATVTTTLPREWPVSITRSAVAVSASAYVEPMTGRSEPSTARSASHSRSARFGFER